MSGCRVHTLSFLGYDIVYDIVSHAFYLNKNEQCRLTVRSTGPPVIASGAKQSLIKVAYKIRQDASRLRREKPRSVLAMTKDYFELMNAISASISVFFNPRLGILVSDFAAAGSFSLTNKTSGLEE